MNQRLSKKYKIDPRNAADIEELIKSLASAYTPEWHFSTEDPDIGSTIGRIFSRQMEENIRSVNDVPEIYRTEFVNLLDLTLKKAVSAGSIVLFTLVDASVPGTEVPKGIRVMTAEEMGEGTAFVTPVFETDQSLYVTASRITDIFQTDREAGLIVPLKGRFEKPVIYEEDSVMASASESEPEPEPAEEAGPDINTEEENEETFGLKPFVLFGEREGIGRHSLIIYHPTVFDVEGAPIYIHFDGGEEILGKISSGSMSFSYLSTDGLIPVDDYSIMEDGCTIRLRKELENKKVSLSEGASPQALIVLDSAEPVSDTMRLGDIRLASEGAPAEPEYVGDDYSSLDIDSFAPFSNTLSLFSECFIGMDKYFDKKGAIVTLDFHLIFLEHELELEKEKEEEKLKIIKRKEKAVREQVVIDAYCEEISIEYFNGIGWKRLSCDMEYRSLFAGEKPGQYKLSFTCPMDWQSGESGAYSGRVLRIRLLSSSNCYLRPAIHHYPVIKDLKISYTYKDRPERPSYLYSISGTRKIDISIKSRMDEPFVAFAPIEYVDDALYLGFDKKIETGPVGILFRISSVAGQSSVKCRFEYSSRRGFRQMRVVDGTASFSKSGIVLFLPPSDFAPVTLEKKRRWWIRIIREEGKNGRKIERFLPHIADIRVNAITVTNTMTGDFEDFYVDEALPNMSFYLGSTNILDTEVWVNERGSLSSEEIRVLLTEYPDRVSAEYDLVGNISSFFVQWQETESFNERKMYEDELLPWQVNRLYRIDRLTGEIIFGDGIHHRIPRVVDDVAFRVRLRTSAGDLGNVPAGTLNTLQQEFLFIQNVTNPVRAYGGSNMETVQEALIRGSHIINSRGRMVSMSDYKRAILGFSGVIDKVSGITGITIDGRDNPAEISFVLLMKDFADGSFSFHRIESALKKFLLSACEITVAPKRLHIVEPIFVAVSVSVWTEVMDLNDSFEVQNQIRDTLNNYLNPVSDGVDSDGWEIGIMPKKSQILLQLQTLKNQALIRKVSITAAYTDEKGDHETDYDELPVNPFMVCVSGVHQVHILYERSE